jgi:chromosomal replication initiator protein
MTEESGRPRQSSGLGTIATSTTPSEAELRAVLSERLGAPRFNLWFSDVVRLWLSGDGNSLEVRVPNPFLREWIQTHYSTSLLDAATAITGRTPRLAIQVQDEAEPPVGDVIEPRPIQTEPDHKQTGPLLVPFPGDPKSPLSFPVVSPSPAYPSIPSRFEGFPRPPTDRQTGSAQLTVTRATAGARPPSCTRRQLENFVVGPSNQLAHAAAVEMARSAGGVFNPLLIHGAVGLGKTHLLEGVRHALNQLHSTLNVLYMTAESFTNSFLEAMRTGALSGFRSRCRSAGALIVDDVHFLAAKKATQEEFLHTFNALTTKGAPIILAADQHPRLITRLPDELVTRFMAGMVVKIDSPELATRKAFLQARATTRGITLPEPVAAYIAEHIRTNVRELEGALLTVIAQAVLIRSDIDLGLAQNALRDTVRHTAQAVALRDVERTVCQLFQVNAEALRSESRARAVAYPRMLAMYLARKHVGAAYAEIGHYFGGRNHSTVMAAERKVRDWLQAEQKSSLLPGFETVGDLLANLERSLGG